LNDLTLSLLTRRGFLGAATGAGANALAAGVSGSQPAQTNAAQTAVLKRGQIFADPTFDFTTQIALGSSYYGCTNPGKVFAIASKITDGDFESAYQAYHAAGREATQLAEEAVRQRHQVSAREAYLWAGSYFYASLYFLDGSADPTRLLPTWKEYETCWAAAAALFNPPIERVEIPYENTSLTGWFFRASGSKERRPLVILNNGSDGSELAVLAERGAAGVERGYNCLTFNGPGQGDSLWVKKLYFLPDWERVITPVVDFALKHPAVDAERIALIGVSQGGYWVPRALAFEHRVAAGVADPGVWNLSAAWTQRMPEALTDLIDSGDKQKFDQAMTAAVAQSLRLKALLNFRMRPYGMTSYFDVFRAVCDYNLKNIAGQIRCPMLITNPEGEPFFPGQPQELYHALACPKALIDFTAEQGAQLHCEVNAPGYRDFRIYNWLDEELGIGNKP
jgi:hypothetical protein